MVCVYKAPSKVTALLLDINLYDGWDLEDHAGLQAKLLSKGHPFIAGWDEMLVDELVDLGGWEHSFWSKEDRYHIAFGMISQFTRGDIMNFLNMNDTQRQTKNDHEIFTIEQKTGYKFQWRVGDESLKLIKSARKNWKKLPNAFG